MAFTNDNNQDNDQNQQNPQNSLLTGTGGGTASPMSNPAQANRQGSGRFTNMQKYVQANQQGAQNLAQRVGTGIQNQLNAKEKDVSQASRKVKKDIDTGNDAVLKAQGQQQELQDIAVGFGDTANTFKLGDVSKGAFGDYQTKAQQFTKSPNYGAFKTFQSGNAIDEQALNTAQQNAAQNAQNYQNLFKQRQQQIGTGTGREQALGEFVGGQGQAVRPAYSAGQRKLDQLVMGQNAQALQSLIDRVGGNQANVAQALSNVEQNATNLSGLTQAEQDTIKAINKSAQLAGKNFQGAYSADKVNEYNKNIQQQYKDVLNQVKSGNINKELASQMGLDKLADLSTYNLLEEIDPQAYLNYKGDIQTAAQLANQQDVSTETALADIVSGGPETLARKFMKVGERADSNLGYNVVQGGAEGQSALARDILARQQLEKDLAAQTGLAYEGKDSYWDWGSRKEKRQTSHGTVADLLAGSINTYGDRGTFSQNAGTDIYQYLSPVLGNAGGDIAGAIRNVASNVGGVFSSGAGGAADAAYRNSVTGLYQQLGEYLKNRGYGKKINIG